MTDQAIAESETAPTPDAAPEPSAEDPRPSLEEWRAAEAETRKHEEARNRGAEALRHEWGESYDARMADARRLVQDTATPELVAAIDRAGLGDDPHFLRALAGLAERIYAPAPVSAAEAARIHGRLDELHALQHHKDPARRAEYRSRAVQDELARLYTAIHGDGPVVGRARRG